MFDWLLGIAGECDPITNGLRLLDCTVVGNASYCIPVGGMTAYQIQDALRSKGVPVRYLGILEGGQTIIFNVPKGKAGLAEAIMSSYRLPYQGG